MTITGNEQPLIFGYSRDITCNVTGMEVSSMTWMWAVAGYQLPFLEGRDVNVLVLQLHLFPEDGSTWDGSEFTCIAIGTDGRTVEQRITIHVKGTHTNLCYEC